MTLATQCGLTLARAALIGAGAALAAGPIRGMLAIPAGRERRIAWAALLVPYLTPVILVGYAYSNTSLSLIRSPVLNEALYDALLFVKLVPVAALVLHLAPRSMSAQAVHCHRLLRSGTPGKGAFYFLATRAGRAPGVRRSGMSPFSALSFWLRGPGRSYAAAFALVFVLATPEFEMASLMIRPSWTVALFDAQAGGLVLSESLRAVLVPAAVETALLAGVLALLFAGTAECRSAAGGGRTPSKAARLGVWAYLAAAAIVTTAIPMVVVLGGTVRGLALLLEGFVLGKDIAASLLFGGGAAVCAYAVARAVVGGGAPAGARAAAAIALAVPGLLGALVLSLVTLSVFQLPGMRHLRATVVPGLVALTLLVLPFALVLEALLGRLRPAAALHLAGMLIRSPHGESRRRAGGIVWALRTRMHLWAVFLVFVLAYFDMTIGSLLSPPGMSPVFVKLYNFMHYGQSSTLSAMVCLSALVPVVLLAAAPALGRSAERILARG